MAPQVQQRSVLAWFKGGEKRTSDRRERASVNCGRPGRIRNSTLRRAASLGPPRVTQPRRESGAAPRMPGPSWRSSGTPRPVPGTQPPPRRGAESCTRLFDAAGLGRVYAWSFLADCCFREITGTRRRGLGRGAERQRSRGERRIDAPVNWLRRCSVGARFALVTYQYETGPCRWPPASGGGCRVVRPFADFACRCCDSWASANQPCWF